ncbi:MAG: flagellar M-ring protein FliF C-terminal domain-containing protein [Candidatus Baltobacteraceae bacterium]
MLAFARIPAWWSSLPRIARLAGGAGALALVACTIVATVLAHPPRAPLFAAPLHPEQLTEVEERLANWNVPFTPSAENVVVEAARRNDLLLRLSLAGVPHAHLSSTGEALANVGVLTPQAVVDAQTRAGLAGDIEAGLRGIDGIDDARVIVAPAKPAEFADDSERNGSAGVRLRMRAGAALSRDAVAGIRAFVAASVPGLDAARVTILDDRGIALGEGGEDGGDATEMQRSLQSALDQALGDGSTIVRVHAEYAGEETSERELRRAPLAAPPVARVSASESYDGSGKRYRRLDRRDDLGTETHELLSQAHPGGLRRLSTAVFVDESRAFDVTKVRELAAAAVGYDPRRGDVLAVESIDFRRVPVARKDLWWLLYGTLVPLAPAVALAVGLVLAARLAVPPALALLQSLIERVAVERASKAAVGFAPARVRSMLAQEPAHAAAAIISALPAATATAVLELYPPHEREAIVRRMQRQHAPLLDDAGELLNRHA